MNEIRPHTAWARRTLLRARVFGVAAEDVVVRRPAGREPVPVTVRTTDRASVAMRAARGADRPGDAARALLGLALRRNPRRAQLLVSRVLGKHMPDRSAAGARGRAAARRAGRRRAGRAPPAALRAELLHAAAARGPRGDHDAVPRGRSRRRPGAGPAGRAGARVRRDGHRARALRRRGPRRRRLPALHPPPGARGRHGGRRSPRSTRTPPSTCCCRPIRPCCAATGRWCWSTTS